MRIVICNYLFAIFIGVQTEWEEKNAISILCIFIQVERKPYIVNEETWSYDKTTFVRVDYVIQHTNTSVWVTERKKKQSEVSSLVQIILFHSLILVFFLFCIFYDNSSAIRFVNQMFEMPNVTRNLVVVLIIFFLLAPHILMANSNSNRNSARKWAFYFFKRKTDN